MKRQYVCRAAVLLLFGGSIVASVESVEQKNAWKGRVENKDGVSIVYNPEKPVYGEVRLDLREELSLGREDDERYLISGWGPLAVNAAGNIAIYNYKDAVIREYDASGTYLRTFGRKGQGPGEYQFVQSLFYDENGRLIALETNRLIVYGPDGKNPETMTWQSQLGASVPLGKNFIGRTMVRESYSVEMITPKGETIRELDRFAWPVQKAAMFQMGFGYMNPFLPQIFFAPLGGGKAAYVYGLDYRYRVLDPSGRMILEVQKEEKGESYTDKDKSSILAAESEANEKPISDFKDMYVFPDRKSFIYGMTADQDGWVYLMRTPVEKGKRPDLRFDVFDADGRYLARIVLPSLIVSLNYLFRNDRLYAWTSDPESGDVFLKRYRIANLKEIGKAR